MWYPHVPIFLLKCMKHYSSSYVKLFFILVYQIDTKVFFLYTDQRTKIYISDIKVLLTYNISTN